MYMLNMVIILIVMYCNVVTAIDKIPTYLLRFNTAHFSSSFLHILIPSATSSLVSMRNMEKACSSPVTES